ncbi:uncharacterized protein LOC118764672 [Octopus sinensis]|uniref:Uncharacterized protein LOC118764672 n=1 Tax=Octopus sinensis TaxID=2607531 RepID=A0A7E6F1K0_9MOLL|nr:uncharacterized protein LOC118764672 [Octopus sinensis]
MSRAVTWNLGMTNYVRQRRHLLTAKAKAIRAERYPKLLSSIKHQRAGKLVFVNGKTFIVDAEVNRRNSRVIAYNPSDVPFVFETKNLVSVMVFGAVASDGSVMDLHFIESGLKIGTKIYLDILKNSLLLWME